MIIVVEGISASGKSTWCARHGADHVIPEAGRLAGPDASKNPADAAAFWVAQNASRWRAALAVEDANDPAICDTDPLKLHYVWCLWQIGEAPESQWHQEKAATRQAILERRIGFADAYFVGAVDPHIARQRRDGDALRRRRNFDLHIRLQPPLMIWYRTLGSILPGEVVLTFPERLPSTTARRDEAGMSRYDVALFDQAMARLPNPPPN
jgi:hypothetical protein